MLKENEETDLEEPREWNFKSAKDLRIELFNALNNDSKENYIIFEDSTKGKIDRNCDFYREVSTSLLTYFTSHPKFSIKEKCDFKDPDEKILGSITVIPNHEDLFNLNLESSATEVFVKMIDVNFIFEEDFGVSIKNLINKNNDINLLSKITEDPLMMKIVSF